MLYPSFPWSKIFKKLILDLEGGGLIVGKIFPTDMRAVGIFVLMFGPGIIRFDIGGFLHASGENSLTLLLALVQLAFV